MENKMNDPSPNSFPQVVLNPKYLDAFMLLEVDLIANKAVSFHKLTQIV